ncbi:putative RING-H2 finger protein ATL21B [Punica granatum]|uniref:RING-type domain-containing protein n=2 Tax=Punica granatum TaxID=22663 RepID=A0A218X556_PUNGR|nr:putative RING-H2 finger protein ATL21B [Punica granatum]OWM79631.1 hypothetical protein CDL15_Pgr023043 [Punica granatum]PKI72431.1 hypothetical protein CRG98_007177 [Punica granatum]
MKTLSLSTTSFFLLFFIFLTLFCPPSTGESQSICRGSVCYRNEPVIRFPFRIPTQQLAPCGYAGFEVSCNVTNQTLFRLPNSGYFSIQGIDYGEQEIWINDPDNCLPRRILSLNLSGSSFTAVYYQEFSFFRCSSSNYIKYGLNPVACLSSPNYTVFATSSYKVVEDLTGSCELMAVVPVPVQWPFFEQVLSSDLSDDLRLTWATPRCGRCESRGGKCGLKVNSSTEVECRNVPQHGIPRAARYAITFGVGVPGLMLIMGLICCVCGRVKSFTIRPDHQVAELASSTITSQANAVSGLDGATIESYPKVVLGESRRLPKPDDATCAICLSEYQPKETIKTIPECNHGFHAECIDQWLELNGSCPICRNSLERPMGTMDAV